MDILPNVGIPTYKSVTQILQEVEDDTRGL